MGKKSTNKKIKIALQGGGAHGAFTWGVLDRLLDEESIDIIGASGTSAGALNAAVMLSGLVKGGREEAKENLYKLWRKVHEVSAFTLEQVSPLLSENPFFSEILEYSYANFIQFWKNWSSFLSLSPYEFNPLGINPLRKIVAHLADFEALNNAKQISIWIGTTNVRNGQSRLFTQPELSLDVVMASACLPELYRAVEIEGIPYWDGGYTSNPPLIPLVREDPALDLLLVQINPFQKCETPRDNSEIMSRLNQINFNNSLIKELYHIAGIKRLQNLPNVPKREIRLHRIEAEEQLGAFNLESKYDTRWSFLSQLRDIGYGRASDWLDNHLDQIGQNDTFDLDRFIESDVIKEFQEELPTGRN